MKYRYYSAMRPIVPGGYPKNGDVPEIINYDEKQEIPEISKRVWGYIEYASPLTAKQIADYELIPDYETAVYEVQMNDAPHNGPGPVYHDTPIPKRENKQKICRMLAAVIQQTRGGDDLKSLEYDEKTEIVTAYFAGGGKRRINVACDSGFAMMKDIINHFGI